MAKRDIKGTAFNSGVFPERLKMALHGQVGKYKGTVITQKQLANDLGVKPQTIGQYVNSVSLPGAQNLADIADYFDLSADYLLGRTDVPSPSSQMAADYLGLSDTGIRRIKRIKDKRTIELVLYTASFYYLIGTISNIIDTSEERKEGIRNLEKEAERLGVSIYSIEDELKNVGSNLGSELATCIRKELYKGLMYEKNFDWEYPTTDEETLVAFKNKFEEAIGCPIDDEFEIDEAKEFFDGARAIDSLNNVLDFEEG